MDIFDLPKQFISRKREVEAISYGFTKSNTVLLIGIAGIGKTTLAKYYAEISKQNYREVTFIRGYEFDFNQSVYELFNFKFKQKSERLFVIDGFDEIVSNETKNKVLQIVAEGRKYGIKTLITSRQGAIDNILYNNSYQVILNGWDQEQVMDFFKKKFPLHLFDSNFIKQFSEIAFTFNGTPLLLNLAVEFLNIGNNTPKDLLAVLKDKLHYKNSIIELFSSSDIIKPKHPEIILPKTPKIISDVCLINSNLINKIKQNPKLIYQLSSRQFEEVVAELFDKEGYQVTITQATRDGGKDLIILEQKRIGNFIIYVECKNYGTSYPIGVRIVRELYGAVTADRATAGVLVTSSYFSTPAKKFTEKVKSQLSLIDYNDLKKWIDEKGNLC